MKQINSIIFPVALILFTLYFYSSFASKSAIYSTRLVHRFSVEAHGFGKSNGTGTASFWPEKKAFEIEQMRMLLGSDAKRQRMKLLGAQNQVFVGSEEGRTFNFGNDMGWLHYAWIDIGTPSNSYFVALDTGSDMLWVPCDCVKCAPLTSSSADKLDKHLKEYSPSRSSSSRQVPCSHELCEMGSNCKSPQAHCPYSVAYLSDDTTSSGSLYEDQFHLMPAGGTGSNPQNPLHATIIIGCGSKQTGDYMDGVAPDGVLGLGPGQVSVPSLLAKSGLVVHSFSFCYDRNHSGRLYFGDQGPSSQKSTPFLPLKGNQTAYIVEVEAWCIEDSCLNKNGFKAQVDTGSSFTYLPSQSYRLFASAFHRQLHAQKVSIAGFDYCYTPRVLKASSIPHVKLVFSNNQSFVIEDPLFYIPSDEGGLYCLGILSIDEDFGILGQNVMMGYRVVFDWERLKMGWSFSSCHDVADGGRLSPNPLPTDDQTNHHRRDIAPAVAVLAPPGHSDAFDLAVNRCNLCEVVLLLLLWTSVLL